MNKNKNYVSAFVLLFLLVGCSNAKPKESTDLTSVTVDTISINDEMDSIDLKGYTPSDKYSGDYSHKFDELIIDNKGGYVSYIFTAFDDSNIDIQVHNQSMKNRTIEDVEELLGTHFTSGTYDFEQKLRYIIYIDQSNKIQAKFVYTNVDTQNKQLVFLELRSIE